MSWLHIAKLTPVPPFDSNIQIPYLSSLKTIPTWSHSEFVKNRWILAKVWLSLKRRTSPVWQYRSNCETVTYLFWVSSKLHPSSSSQEVPSTSAWTIFPCFAPWKSWWSFQSVLPYRSISWRSSLWGISQLSCRAMYEEWSRNRTHKFLKRWY